MTDERDLADLDAAKEVRIETRAADGAVHRTIIWVMVEGGEVYIRSYRGPTARWYREALERPDVALHVSKRRIPFRAVPATDAASIAACSAGLERKYRRSYSLGAMLREDVLGTTLRLDPA
ncbi:MAG TPA: DUF2255 family protein [Candidatus Polarisedimenticolia bacterium]|nr:DUF2255 family protein [Candidatus Polarisedimenticolia bacterium]